MRVRKGRERRKHNWRIDRGDYFVWPQEEIRLDRRDPGVGCRHVITIPQLRRFVRLLPDWDEVAVGLNAIVLGAGASPFGWYDEASSVVVLCAWPAHSGFWFESTHEWNAENERLLSLLGVQIDEREGRVGLLWTEAQARAFMLLDVLPHELGHHHDRMTTRTRRLGRGEPFAERYAREVLERLWPIYTRHFEI